VNVIAGNRRLTTEERYRHARIRGERLNEELIARAMNAADLHRVSGVSNSTIRHYLDGRAVNPRRRTVVLYARGLLAWDEEQGRPVGDQQALAIHLFDGQTTEEA
jgi:hypothetical protein